MRAVNVKLGTVVVALGAAVWACETTRNPGGIQPDLVPPLISLSKTGPDTQPIAGGLSFTVSAVDNLGLKEVELFFTGGHIGQDDTVFTSTVKDYQAQTSVVFPAGSGAGGLVQIVGRATDGAQNSASDTLSIFLSNISALQVTLLSPAPGAVASQNRGIPVDVTAFQNEGIQKIGFLVTPGATTNPTVPPNDSILFTLPYSDSVRYVDTLVVLAATGTFNIVGFAEDSSGRRGTSNVVTVQVLSAQNDTAAPKVDHTVASRVEVNDSVTVHATDPSGISWMGLRITRASNGALLRFDTVNVTTNPALTDVTRKFSLNLGAIIPPDSVPFSIVVRGYACDLAAARNCAFSSNSTVIQTGPTLGGGPFLAPGTDTVVVVAGVTTVFPRRPFPTQIADAIFNANRNELYLTNTTNDLVEVFQVANTTFVAGGIPKAGAQPWGIGMWPADTLGNYIDRIVVANSGGTQLAIMDATTRLPLWRQDLPNFLIESYHVTVIGGGFQEIIVAYDLSDRPQYLATVCRPTTGGGPPCHADSIFALYSTTPTPSQPSPFTNKGTLRMEKLINTTDPAQLYGKFFWEISQTTFQGTGLTDTLRIELHRGPPYNVRKTVLSACAGIIVDFSRMGLGDRTFARNSGDFTHGFFGEGGNVAASFARVMAYDARDQLFHGNGAFAPPIPAQCVTDGTGSAFPGFTSDFGDNDVDLGMSPGVDVSDFISNTATKVSSIATNFNGRTNAVRADSIYYIGEDLRLKGTSIIPDDTVVVGMDMNYFHDFAPTGQCNPNCGGTGSTDNRIIFAARPDGSIAVFDTYFGFFVGSIAVRDPIIGPLRVARDATGTAQYLFGVTARGVVVVRIPPFSNPGPVPPYGGSR